MASLNITNTIPPGGWSYEQKDNAGVVVRKKWANTMSPYGDFVREIVRFRKANGYARPAMVDVSTDVQNFMCEKRPELCNAQKKTHWQPARAFRRPTPETAQDVAAAVAAFGKLNSV